MARRKRQFDERVLARFVKEKRGQGELDEYRPWYRFQDISSIGVAFRTSGRWTHRRVVHLFSKLERDWFYVFDWSDNVLDIREQYPLLPQKRCQAIAEEAGIRYPCDPRTNFPIVITTDFLLFMTTRNGPAPVARTVKYSRELSRRRVLEKFEIERRFWRGVDWQICTEKNLPRTAVRNIEFLRDYLVIDDRISIDLDVRLAAADFLAHGLHTRQQTLAEAAAAADAYFALPKGSSLTLAYHLMAIKAWHIDIQQPLTVNSHLAIFTSDVLDDVFDSVEPEQEALTCRN